MANTTLNVVLKLRRDNDYNYERIKDSFVPAKGEPVLVDTARDGLRVKIGDGVKTFDELDFFDSLFVNGYLSNGIFYKDELHTDAIPGLINKLYINSNTGKLYHYTGTEYAPVGGVTNANADSSTAGILKLYDEKGSNTDGTITQRLFTEEINKKIEVDINGDDELIVFRQSFIS